MCETGTCRPCRLEDRELDRAMGTVREYITGRPPSREENLENRSVASLSLHSVKRSSIYNEHMTEKEKSSIRKKTLAETRKRERELKDGRLTSIHCPCHGTYSGYVHWYCLCMPCTNAYNARRAERLKGRGRKSA